MRTRGEGRSKNLPKVRTGFMDDPVVQVGFYSKKNAENNEVQDLRIRTCEKIF